MSAAMYPGGRGLESARMTLGWRGYGKVGASENSLTKSLGGKGMKQGRSPYRESGCKDALARPRTWRGAEEVRAGTATSRLLLDYRAVVAVLQ